MSLSAPINTPERPGEFLTLGVAAATHLYPGQLIARNSSGYAVAAADTAGLIVLGRCEQDVDNSAGSAGDLSVVVKRGVFRYLNSTASSSANALTIANRGEMAYVEDDQTVVNKTGATNEVAAGIIVDFDADLSGVWIDTRGAWRVPNADTLTALTFSSTVTQAEGQALRNALKTILQNQGLMR